MFFRAKVLKSAIDLLKRQQLSMQLAMDSLISSNKVLVDQVTSLQDEISALKYATNEQNKKYNVLRGFYKETLRLDPEVIEKSAPALSRLLSEKIHVRVDIEGIISSGIIKNSHQRDVVMNTLSELVLKKNPNNSG